MGWASALRRRFREGRGQGSHSDDDDADRSTSGSIPGFLKPGSGRTTRVKKFLRSELNFYVSHNGEDDTVAED